MQGERSESIVAHSEVSRFGGSIRVEDDTPRNESWKIRNEMRCTIPQSEETHAPTVL